MERPRPNSQRHNKRSNSQKQNRKNNNIHNLNNEQISKKDFLKFIPPENSKNNKDKVRTFNSQNKINNNKKKSSSNDIKKKFNNINFDKGDERIYYNSPNFNDAINKEKNLEKNQIEKINKLIE